MGKSKLRCDLRVVQHGNENIGLFGDILVIAAGKANFDRGQFQVQLTQVITNPQGQLQEFLFGLLEHQLRVLRSRFCRRPAVTHDDSGTGVTGGRTTIAVRHTADRKHRVVQVVNQGLRLRLIKLGSQIFDLCLELRVNILELDCTLSPKLLIILGGNIDIVEQHKSLNELLNTVKTVAVHIVHSVQKGKNDLKGTEPSIVQRIFHDGNTKYLFLGFQNHPSVADLVVVVFGVAAINSRTVTLDHILHAHDHGRTKAIVADNESKPRVERENLEGGFIFLYIGFTVRKNHAVGGAADVRPISQLLVLCGFVLGRNIAVQRGNLLGNALVINPADILDGFTHQVADLEGNDLVCSVFNDLVVDLRPYFLHTGKDRLIALVIPVEVFHVSLICGVGGECFPQNFNHIAAIDFGNIGGNDLSSKPSAAHGKHLPS